jgi:hypothetical protein
MDEVKFVVYRLVRPDGTLLWNLVVPNYMAPPTPPVSPGTAERPGDYVRPPWRYEAREQGASEWTLLAEKN